MYIYVYMCVCICMYVYVYVYMYIYMYIVARIFSLDLETISHVVKCGDFNFENVVEKNRVMHSPKTTTTRKSTFFAPFVFDFR